MRRPYKILFSNIGYARGIDGSLRQHLRHFGRNFYLAAKVQERVLAQVQALVRTENPDLCCFVEVDQGSLYSARINQVKAMINEVYPFHNVADKYGENSRIGKLPLHQGKSNAFLSKEPLEFQRLYFSHGSKRLIYRVRIPGDIDVIFAHFSLLKKTRAKQFAELRGIIKESGRETVIMADFNIFRGFDELKPLLEEMDLEVLSKAELHTYRFHERHWTLDLAIVSKTLAQKAGLRIIPQPFSDHAALLLEIKDN